MKAELWAFGKHYFHHLDAGFAEHADGFWDVVLQAVLHCRGSQNVEISLYGLKGFI